MSPKAQLVADYILAHPGCSASQIKKATNLYFNNYSREIAREYEISRDYATNPLFGCYFLALTLRKYSPEELSERSNYYENSCLHCH